MSSSTKPKKRKRPIDPTKKRLNVYLSLETHKRLKVFMASESIPHEAQALEELLRRAESKEKEVKTQ